MYKKYYIKDFVEDFNYSGIMFYVSDSVSLGLLREKLKDVVLINRMFYIENCDLQIISSASEILDLFKDDYELKILYEDENGFFIRLEALQWNSKKNTLQF